MTGRRGRNPLPSVVNPFWRSPVVVGPRRYCRLMWMGSEDGVFQTVAEIEFAATPSGADLATGGSVIASTRIVNPANAFDNNTSTLAVRVATSDLDDLWIGYDFTAPVTVQEVRITAEATDFNRTPTAFFVQVSDDNVTWQTVCLHVTSTAWTTGQVRAFAVPGSFEVMNTRETARVWRINVSNNHGNATTAWFDTTYMQSSGGANLATGGVPFSDNCEGQSFPPANAFNGTLTDRFSSNFGTVPVFLWYCFSTAPNPTHITLASGNTRQDAMPEAFTVDWTADGTNWNTVASFTGVPSWGASVRREYVL